MNRLMWLLLALAGVALVVFAVWLDVHDGSPTMQKGDQPIEVVLTAGLGLAALGNGLYRFFRSFKHDNDEQRRN